MNRHFRTAICVAVLGMWAAPVMSDGSHGVKIEFKSEIGGKKPVKVEVHNGNTPAGEIFDTIVHKVYTLKRPGKRTLKCHGQTKDRCKIRIKMKGEKIISGFIKDKSTCIFKKFDRERITQGVNAGKLTKPNDGFFHNREFGNEYTLNCEKSP